MTRRVTVGRALAWQAGQGLSTHVGTRHDLSGQSWQGESNSGLAGAYGRGTAGVARRNTESPGAVERVRAW
jgi:hypothetical protein